MRPLNKAIRQIDSRKDQNIRFQIFLQDRQLEFGVIQRTRTLNNLKKLGNKTYFFLGLSPESVTDPPLPSPNRKCPENLLSNQSIKKQSDIIAPLNYYLFHSISPCFKYNIPLPGFYWGKSAKNEPKIHDF